MKLTCYVVCSTHNGNLVTRVMEVSYQHYISPVPLLVSAPDLPRTMRGNIHAMPNTGTSFGESYNAAVHQAFNLGYDRVVICNDDIVFRPDTHEILMQDLNFIEAQGITNWSHIATRTDMVMRNAQHVALNPGTSIIETDMVAPICSVVQPSTWIDFPHCNSFSDNVQCRDMKAAGSRIFVSRAYVHHVGGISIADPTTARKDMAQARDYLRRTRSDANEMPFLQF